MNVEDLPPAPGKFASTVRVGEKGQIVIPKGARDLFGIKPGDTLLLLADVDQGIAIVRQDLFDRFIAESMPTAPPDAGGEQIATSGQDQSGQGQSGQDQS